MQRRGRPGMAGQRPQFRDRLAAIGHKYRLAFANTAQVGPKPGLELASPDDVSIHVVIVTTLRQVVKSTGPAAKQEAAGGGAVRRGWFVQVVELIQVTDRLDPSSRIDSNQSLVFPLKSVV